VRLQSRIEQNRLQFGGDQERASCGEDSLSKRIRAAILEGFRDPDFSPSTLAEILHVNPNHMSRVYRQETGGTIIEELIDTRMCEARRLMDGNPSMPVCDVARLCGYSDPLYFSKAFKKKFGVSPQQIKKLKKERVFFP
jgi:AraC-like DNA-binding protein